MKKPAIVIAFALVILTGLTLTSAYQNKPEAKPAKPEEAKKLVLPNCPVMDEPVDFNVALESKDGPVYFCCAKCMGKYEADPKKYEKAVAEQRAACAKLPKVQVKCPMTGKPVDKKSFIEKDGQKIYFCCPKCPDLYKMDEAKNKAKLASCYTYQTKCPVMGESIDPKSSMTTADGKTIYFCCDDCKPKILKDPAKYLPKLEEQGYKFDADKIKSEKK